MKLNKRVKSALIQAFFFNIVLLFVIIVLVLTYFWPSFQQMQDEKQNLISNHKNFVSTQKQGISLSDFQSLTKGSDFTLYLKEVIKSTWKDFYDRNFINNNSESNFKAFIEEKRQDVEKQQKASILEERNETVNKILPAYVTDTSEEWITDFEFINYVESLLYSFNLVSKDSIWVGKIEKVDDVYQSKKNNLDSNIFYIPLSLEITGQKSDIIDFIHYLENVWSIDLREWEIDTYSDDKIWKNIFWETSEKNIYRNQFSDIEMISMQTYIDSSSDPVRWTFTDFIQSTQKRQKFSVEMDLRFYVQWLPDYKIENYIKSILQMHSNLLSESQKILKLTFNDTWDASSSTIKAKNAIRSLSNILSLMEDDIKALRVWLSKKNQDLTVLYSEAEDYEQKLKKIQRVLQDSAVELNNKK